MEAGGQRGRPMGEAVTLEAWQVWWVVSMLVIGSGVMLWGTKRRSKHRAIEAMFSALPDEKMSAKHKRRWLYSMKAILDVTYPED